MKLVDLSNYDFVLEPLYYFYGWADNPEMLVRPVTAKMLCLAVKFLPEKHNFKIWDAKRYFATHKRMMESFERRFLSIGLGQKAADERSDKFGCSLEKFKTMEDPATHKNGGAIDLTIIDENGNELDMGTDHDDLTKRAALNFFQEIKNPTDREKIIIWNRNLLKSAMLRAEFKALKHEWWHWSTNKR